MSQHIKFCLFWALFSYACWLHANPNEELLEEIKLLNPQTEIIPLSSPYFALKQNTEKFPDLGTIVIIHDHHEHADWPELIHPLRTKLADYGWHTLSLQFPQQSSEFAAYARSLQQLIQQQKTGNLILITKGRSAQDIATAFKNDLNKFIALVLISHEEPPQKEEPIVLNLIKTLGSRPILDIYAANDKPNVVRTAASRLNRVRKYGKTANVQYQQMVVPLADHRFYHQESSLIKRITGWLKRYAKKPSPPINNEKSED